MKAFVCCVLFAASALAAPKPEGTQRDKRGLIPAAGLVSPYGLGAYGLGLGPGGVYGGLGYGGLGYGLGLGYGGFGLGHQVPVLASHTPLVFAISKKNVESEPHGNHKDKGDKKEAGFPELHNVHAVPAVHPGLGGLGLHGYHGFPGAHGLPVAHGLPLHGLPGVHAPLW